MNGRKWNLVFIGSSVHRLSNTLKKIEAATLSNTSESMKGTLTATQKHKVGERPKASPMMFPFYQEENHLFD
jgi:hypothetical protein